jgi:isopenicillin N synthase-like dioxygenase
VHALHNKPYINKKIKESRMSALPTLIGQGVLTPTEYDQYTHMATIGTAFPSKLNEESSNKKNSSAVCIDDANIPLFDLAAIISSKGQERFNQVQAFGNALEKVGFVAIEAKEITSLIEKVTAQMELYFSQSHEKKMEDDHKNNFQTGFWPHGFETAAGATQADNKETYFIPPNYQKWPTFSNPQEQEAFKNVMEEYQTILTVYATRCMGLIAEYLGEPTEDVSKSISSAHNLLRLAHYFATESNAPRAGAHYDLNCLTLLPPATGPGLQLRDKTGVWKSINVPKGYLIVNTGEQLEKKTAGKIQATLHQVVKPENEKVDKRLASIFFSSWSTDFSLKPFESCAIEMTKGMSDEERMEYLAKYPDVTVIENLLSRLIEMGGIPDPKEELVKDLHSKGLLKQPPKAVKEKYPELFC